MIADGKFMGTYLVNFWSIFLAIDVTADSVIIVDHHNQNCHRSGAGKDIVERDSGPKAASKLEYEL